MSGPFSAALLAGGRSRRMGTDKAFLRFGEPPQPLWARQLELLGSLGAAQLLLSHNADQVFPEIGGVEMVEDLRGDCGPLGGLVSCLRRVGNRRLLVLAVDLPFVTRDFLAALLSRGGGVVLRDAAAGRYEAVVAVYTPACLEIAEDHLRCGSLAMHGFIEDCRASGQLEVRPVGDEERGQLRNLNRPEDFDAII